MTIFVDSREKDLRIQAMFDEVKWCQYGDFVIEIEDKHHNVRRLIIERKTVPDFWTSLKSGRLNEQLFGCDALLIHHKKDEFDFVDIEKLYDALNGVNKHHMVFHVWDLPHLEKTLRRYERQLAEGTFGEFRKVLVKKDIPTSVRILAEFDGIGIEKSKALLRVYKSLNKVFQAADEQEGILGIGPATMQKISQRLAMEEDVQL